MENSQIIFYSNRPFHSKYRPQKFDQIVGQEHIVSYLKKTIINKRVSFAYLLIGKHGVGKTTLSRLVAKSLNCFDNYINNTFEPCNVCQSCRNINLGKSFDVHEINGAMSNGIENVRDLIEKIQLTSVNNIYKVCIFDEVHMLSINAINALLKILEEPPKNVVFILATTDLNRLPSTLISRCHKLYFLPLNKKDLAVAIVKVIWLEKANITNKALNDLLYFSKGSFRDALTMTDMLVVQNRNIKQDTYSSLFNTSPNSIFQLFLKYIISKDIKKILQLSCYFENKNWLDYILINQIQNIIEENIVNDTNLIFDNDYLIKLFQLLIKSNSSDFYENRLSFFLSKLIAVILNTSSTNYFDNLFNDHLKKNIPSNLKVQIFYVH
jgi:DNA polymerase-3 subunit gamma/tau